MNADARALVILLVIASIAGWLASLLGGSGLLRSLVAGVVGGYLLNAFGVDLGIRNRLASQIVTATIGAIGLVLVARVLA